MNARISAVCRRIGPAWIIFAVAVTVRLGYIAADLPVPPQDTPDYDEIAHNLLSGRGFMSSEIWHGYPLRSWRAPFYPFFLAAVYAIWGHSHLAVQLVQAVVGGGSAFLVYRLARLVQPQAAVMAGILAAVYGPLAASCAEIMTEAWYTLWTLLSLVLLAPAAGGAATESVSGKRLALGGGVLGIAVLTRPVALLMWPALLLCAWRNHGRSGLWRTVLVGLATACVVAPWTLRNYHVHGSLVPVTSQGGFIIARSNATVPAWRQRDGWGIRPEVFAAFPSETERDRRWLRQGLTWIRRHPGSYLRLVGERFLRFWYFWRPEYNFWFMLIMPLAALGWWHMRHRVLFCLPRSYTYLSVWVFCTLLYGSTRFRLPLEPLFLIAAAGTVVTGWRRLGSHRMVVLLGAMSAVHGALWWRGEAVRQGVLAVLRWAGLR